MGLNYYLFFLNGVYYFLIKIEFLFNGVKLLVAKQVLCDVDCGKEFILCEYNRDADSYRLVIFTWCCLWLM